MTVRVVIVRHGESTYNIEKRIQGRSDLSTLTATGIEQAGCVRTALAGIEFQAAYSSPLRRAHQTATEVIKDRPTLTIDVTELLREIDLTEWESLTFADVKAKFPDDYQLWREAPDQLSLGGRYPVPDLWKQAQQFWQFLQEHHPEWVDHTQPGSPVVNLLVVGHSGINRALIGSAVGLQPAHYHRLGQDNCAISVLNFAQGLNHPPQTESINQTAHLGDPIPKSKGGLRLLLVRHGETDWNREQRFQGQRDIPLNPTGQAQAQQVAQFLKDQTLDLAFSSPLKRSWDTGVAICDYAVDGKPAHPHLKIEAVSELQEISHGNWEGLLQSEIEAAYPGQLTAWQTTPALVQMPDGENLQDVWDRTKTAWTRILDEAVAAGPETVSLVTAHDAINKAVICCLFDLSPEYFWAFKQGNGAVTVIDYPEGASKTPVLRSLNITAHMEGGILDCTAAGAL